MRFLRASLALCGCLCVAAQAPSENVSFSRQIAPILLKKCVTCHNPEKSKGGFQLHTFNALQKAGESKRAPVVAGDPKKSRIFELITITDPDDRMPQKDEPLPADQIQTIRTWINQGAKCDGDPNAHLSQLVPKRPHHPPPVNYSRAIPIVALAWLQGGTTLAANGYGELTVWSSADGALRERISDFAEKTQGLAFSPTGHWIAVAGGMPGQMGELAILSAEDHKPRVVGTFPDMALTVAFSPDGQLLACGATDNGIHIFDVASGREKLLIQQHADWVTGLCFSPEGKHLASASRDRSARVYELSKGNLETTYMEHEGAVSAIAYDFKGKNVYSAGKDKKIHIWNAQDGKKVGEIGGPEGEIFQLIATEDRLFCCGSDRLVREYTLSDRKQVRTYAGHQDWVYALALNGESGSLASGSYDGEVRIWDVKTGALLRSFRAIP